VNVTIYFKAPKNPASIHQKSNPYGSRGLIKPLDLAQSLPYACD